MVWNVEEQIDLSKFSELLNFYKGRHNFLSFTVNNSEYKKIDDYIRTIIDAKIELNLHPID